MFNYFKTYWKLFTFDW